MILYFSGTGNSGYAARRIADGLGEPLLCLNDRIKAGDTAPVETGERLVIVTPTYAWRIPRIVEDWLLHTELAEAKQGFKIRLSEGDSAAEQWLQETEDAIRRLLGDEKR